MEFPPRPRGDDRMREEAVARLAGGLVPQWLPVSFRGAQVPWMGVCCEVEVARPWVWEVVTPAGYRDVAGFAGDPMVLVAERDVVLCRLGMDDREIWMHAPVTSAPDQVELPAELLPEGWTVQLESAWSRAAVQSAIDAWALVECGHTVGWEEVPGRGERFDIGGGMWATDAAFDVLLGLDGGRSGEVTAVLQGVLDALGEHLDRRATG